MENRIGAKRCKIDFLKKISVLIQHPQSVFPASVLLLLYKPQIDLPILVLTHGAHTGFFAKIIKKHCGIAAAKLHPVYGILPEKKDTVIPCRHGRNGKLPGISYGKLLIRLSQNRGCFLRHHRLRLHRLRLPGGDHFIHLLQAVISFVPEIDNLQQLLIAHFLFREKEGAGPFQKTHIFSLIIFCRIQHYKLSLRETPLRLIVCSQRLHPDIFRLCKRTVIVIRRQL